jgi:hypothetical protein
MQNALDLGLRTTRRRLRRALRASCRRNLRCGASARQLRDIGLCETAPPARDNAFASAEAQLGMLR